MNITTSKGKRAARQGLAAFAVVAVLGAVNATPASAAAHWANGAYTGERYWESDLYLKGGLDSGAGTIRVDWTGGQVGIRGSVYDHSPNGKGVLLRVSYDYKSGGAWHHASKKVAAKVAGAFELTKFARHSTLPVANLHAQLCQYNSAGTISDCGPVR